MTTRLEGSLKREIVIGDTAYTVTLSPAGFALVVKGRRKGLEIAWADLVSGDAALATALNKSLTANLAPAASKDAAAGHPHAPLRGSLSRPREGGGVKATAGAKKAKTSKPRG